MISESYLQREWNMLTENSGGMYRRLSILGLLLACLIVFSSSDFIERAAAAPCIQDCEAYEAQCYDGCITECGLTDQNCNGCITSCNAEFSNCMSHAVWCEGDPAGNGNCSTEFGTHEASGGNHNGYYQVCSNIIGGGPCVACPQNENCPGAGGIPRCY
jgi:hypothetical protein